jgi:hypothetical protein
VNRCDEYSTYLGLCKVCGCHWRKHKHITYEYKINRIYVISDAKISAESNQEISLRDIDKRISDLREEERQIQDVYRKLAEFLHANALLPINDGYVDYLQYFIREEQMKQTAGADNRDVIANLEKLMTDYNNEMELFQRTLQKQRDAGEERESLESEKVFELAGKLYRLPINGQQIREQVTAIKISQDRYNAQHEKFVELPTKAASSTLMLQLRDILSTR